MIAAAKSLMHRLSQAQRVVLRTELALTFAQILFWVALIAAPVGVVLAVRRRRTPSGPEAWGSPGGPGDGSRQSAGAAAQNTSPSEYRG